MVPPLRPSFCYIEIPALNAEASAAFYAGVFGWNRRTRGDGAPSFDDAAGHISGAFVTGRAIASEPGLLPYIWVEGIDATLAQVEDLGGRVVDSPHLDTEPDGEWIATFRDPAGNLIGLYQEGPRLTNTGLDQ